MSVPAVTKEPPYKFRMLGIVGSVIGIGGWLFVLAGIAVAILLAQDSYEMKEILIAIGAGVGLVWFGVLQVAVGQAIQCFRSIERNTRSS